MALLNQSADSGFTQSLDRALQRLAVFLYLRKALAKMKNRMNHGSAKGVVENRSARLSAGFTLIEILIALTILSAIFGLGFPVTWSFYGTYQFDSEGKVLVSVLEQARNSAMINRNQSAHGVFINDDQMTVFQGASYASRNASMDKIFPRNRLIAISGPAEIVFSALSGQVSSSTYIVSYQHRSTNIQANSYGAIIF